MASYSFIAPVKAALHNLVMAGDIGSAIKQARELRGIPASTIATALRVSVQAVYNWEKNKNLPATDNLFKVAEVLGVSGEALMRGEVVEIEPKRLRDATSPSASTPVDRRLLEVKLEPEAPPFDRINGPRDVEELGISVGGEDGDFTLNGAVVGYVTRPASLRGRDVFAVRVFGDSMFPRYEIGDVLYVERHREPAPGEDGIFEMKPSDEWEAGQAFVKTLVARGAGSVRVSQFRPEKEFEYRRDQIRRMYRVIPRRELLVV